MNRVLLHGPGVAGPQTPGLIARLTRDGAEVDVLVPDGMTAADSAHLDDLVTRGLARIASDAVQPRLPSTYSSTLSPKRSRSARTTAVSSSTGRRPTFTLNVRMP